MIWMNARLFGSSRRFSRGMGLGRRGQRLQIERLEDRTVPAIAFDAVTGTFTITGTDIPDTSTVEVLTSGTPGDPYDDRIRVNLSSSQYSAAGVQDLWETLFQGLHIRHVRKIVFLGLGGDDAFSNTSNVNADAYVARATIRSAAAAGGTICMARETTIPWPMTWEGTTDSTAVRDMILSCAGPDPDRLFGENGNDLLQGGSGIDRLEGGDGNDTLQGGNGDDRCEGGPGNDTLQGGLHADTLRGGTGNDLLRGDEGDDTLYGNGDRDTLYGSSGTDELFGGGGNDGLYGGSGDDTLDGGSGADRFLMHADGHSIIDPRLPSYPDLIEEFQAGDARINFLNGKEVTVTFADQDYTYAGANWDMQSIEQVDLALAQLHQRTANTRLLKTLAGGQLKLKIVGFGEPDISVPGWNSNNGVITFTPYAFPAGHENLAVQSVFHEFGHNWDNEHASWEEFQAISGWTDTDPHSADYTETPEGGWWHLTSADFASWYASDYNPREDFAESFAAYFMWYAGRRFQINGDDAEDVPGQILETIPEKWDFMDELVIGLI